MGVWLLKNNNLKTLLSNFTAAKLLICGESARGGRWERLPEQINIIGRQPSEFKVIKCSFNGCGSIGALITAFKQAALPAPLQSSCMYYHHYYYYCYYYYNHSRVLKVVWWCTVAETQPVFNHLNLINSEAQRKHVCLLTTHFFCLGFFFFFFWFLIINEDSYFETMFQMNKEIKASLTALCGRCHDVIDKFLKMNVKVIEVGVKWAAMTKHIKFFFKALK